MSITWMCCLRPDNVVVPTAPLADGLLAIKLKPQAPGKAFSGMEVHQVACLSSQSASDPRSTGSPPPPAAGGAGLAEDPMETRRRTVGASAFLAQKAAFASAVPPTVIIPTRRRYVPKAIPSNVILVMPKIKEVTEERSSFSPKSR